VKYATNATETDGIDLDAPIPFTLTLKGQAMNPNESYHDAQKRRDAEAKQRRAIEDAEYEANEAQKKAARAARDAQAARDEARRERDEHDRTTEDLRDELDHVEGDKANLKEALTLALAIGAELIEALRQAMNHVDYSVTFEAFDRIANASEAKLADLKTATIC